MMHDKGLLESTAKNGVKNDAPRPKADEICGNHVLSERKRREKTKPTIHDSQITGTFKQQDDTIKCLQDLERRVEELVTCSELMELETRTKRQPRDGVERTSDNYSSNKNIANRKKKYMNKRKASDIGEAELEIECVASKDNVVVIQFRCPWRDGLDALSNSQFGLPFSSIIHHSDFSHSL